MPDVDYILGHSPAEIRRLKLQADILKPISERLLREAGVAPGMRVLDLGCGAGDVALLAAEMVGPNGAVVGIDRNGDALSAACSRARGAGHANVEFREGAADDRTCVRLSSCRRRSRAASLRVRAVRTRRLHALVVRPGRTSRSRTPSGRTDRASGQTSAELVLISNWPSIANRSTRLRLDPKKTLGCTGASRSANLEDSIAEFCFDVPVLTMPKDRDRR